MKEQVKPLRTQSAFTLIELLVVIAIIAILAAILFPVFAPGSRCYKRLNCLSNLKQLGTAIAIYQSDADDQIPPYFTFDGPEQVKPSSTSLFPIPKVKKSSCAFSITVPFLPGKKDYPENCHSSIA